VTTPIGPYSPIVRAGDWLVCSGQLGLVDGQLVDGVSAQTTQAIKNAGALLAGHGASLTDVVKTLVFLADMGEGLQHHYAVNDHHPEHFDNGIRDMGLVQLTEMLADWKAATMRHEDGDLGRSIEQNAERFGYGDEIKRLLRNTASDFGWL